MIKKYFYLALVVIVASLSFVITYDYYTKVHSRSDLVFMKNIEALAANVGGTDHYWCCGNVDTCVKGDNFVIKGKFQNKPCE